MPSPDPACHSASNRRGAARTSDILLDVARGFPRERVRLQDLVQRLGNRSFGFLLLIFALPNTLPLGIPVLSTVTGIPLALVALQMLLGFAEPYMPTRLARQSVRRHDLCRVIERTAPWLQKLERFMKPRWLLLTGILGERLLGGFCLLFAIVLALPIPFGNAPPAIAVTLIALGLIEKDGVLASVGVVVGAISLIVVWGVVWGMVQAAALFFEHALLD